MACVILTEESETNLPTRKLVKYSRRLAHRSRWNHAARDIALVSLSHASNSPSVSLFQLHDTFVQHSAKFRG
jgi:hypothetical protein